MAKNKKTSLCTKSVFYDPGKRKPPIPTPRPKGLGLRNFDGCRAPMNSTLDVMSPDHEINSNNEDHRNEKGNIYETLDFRGSLNLEAGDEKLPDILMHTLLNQNEQHEEIYESLDIYQVYNWPCIQLIH